ncbi:MAG: MMPL family transporter [Bacteroidota bacterium]
MEAHLYENGGVGKSTSLAKVVRTVNRKLQEDKASAEKIPDDISGVGQCIVSYQNSHIPEFLWHFVSPDFKSANLWLQLKSGDNKDMEQTIAVVEDYLANHPPPAPLAENWFGLTYINVVWQQKMVQGMLEAFLGSFVIVFLMMLFLFRSFKWAILSILPLSLTILMIYGVIGWIGKDYDMPVAVLSSLALGLAVDFAIHFLVRSKASLKETQDWQLTSQQMFGEPARAITRNVIVIAVGFLPLLLANLIPYRTVGMILASILLLSGVITLLLLPALVKLLFGNQKVA